MRKLRVIWALCLCMLVSIGFLIPAYAETPDLSSRNNPMLRWQNVISISAGLTISNGRANMSGSVIANSGTENITVNAVLERVNPNGTRTIIWSQNGLRANGITWVWERPHMVSRGNNYRLTLTATAIRNGVSETVTISRTTWSG